jgi:anthranilate phosphoribosyltransferase
MSNSISWSEIFACLKNRTNLTSAQSLWAMNTVMDGKATNEEIKELLLGLKERVKVLPKLLHLWKAC